jgi:8-oxo-dGTP pyrophosphatase MutT (NUDIX family)
MPISDYLRGLRTKVGTQLLLMPAVTLVCRDEQGRILLARHHDYDQWALPGGTIDPGETPADTAVREMWEETGLLVEPVRVLGVYGGASFCITYPNGDQIASVDTVFECRVVGGKLAADQEEISELRYFSEVDLAKLPLPLWKSCAPTFGATVATPTFSRTGGCRLPMLCAKVAHRTIFAICVSISGRICC